jgi:hypothetical protein
MKLFRNRSARQIVARVLPVCFTLLATPLIAAAAEGEKEVYDARLEGYPQNVTLQGGSTALSWLLLIVLAALCVGVLFKNANRSHLD